MANKVLTTKDVARICKVSDATVKRWEEAGLISSERTNGGHRRFRADEVARFQREQCLGVPQEPGEESANGAAVRRTKSQFTSESPLFQSLVSGRECEAADLLISSFLNGSTVAEIFDSSLSKTMNRIGSLWFEGKLSVAQEHLATRSAMSAIYKLRCTIPLREPCGKLLFCFALEGDFHELPSHLVQLLFESEGWEVMNFGANTPLYSLEKEISRHSPDLVCVSSTVMKDIDRLSRDYSDFRKLTSAANTPVILGGQAFEQHDISSRFPADHYPATFSDLAALAESYTS